MTDLVNHPPHYSSGRFGVECIAFARYMTFPAGNAFKYIWRHADKGNPVQDLEKALVYLDWARDDFANGNTWPVMSDYEQHLRILSKTYLTGTEDTVYAALDLIRDGVFGIAIDCVKKELERLR
jgi:hypothetical protein